MADYVFDNKAREAEQRFGGLEAIYDPVSIRHLEPYVVAGSRCLEVGGGGGSIACWMSERVGERGRVVVTSQGAQFANSILRLTYAVIRFLGRPQGGLPRVRIAFIPS